MNKKLILGLVGVLAILSASVWSYLHKPLEKTMQFAELQNYFLRNDIPLEENRFNYFIIENKDEFEALFGIAKTFDNEIKEPDFSKEMVVAIANSPNNYNNKISINSITSQDDSIYVDFSYFEGEKRTFSALPLKIISITKPIILRDLYFFQNGSETKKISLGRRNLSSPINYDDMKQNYIGEFYGEIPCADCEMIKTTLIINPDNTYEISRVYQGKTKIPFKESGIWRVSSDLAVIELLESDAYYYIQDQDTLEMLDNNMQKIRPASKLDFRAIDGNSSTERSPEMYTSVHEDTSTGTNDRYTIKSQLRDRSIDDELNYNLKRLLK